MFSWISSFPRLDYAIEGRESLGLSLNKKYVKP